MTVKKLTGLILLLVLFTACGGNKNGYHDFIVVPVIPVPEPAIIPDEPEPELIYEEPEDEFITMSWWDYSFTDIPIILNHAVDIEPLPPLEFDLNKDGVIDTADALIILQIFTGAINTQGNTFSNIRNNGIATIQGDWIYYIDKGDGDNIYKIRTDGTEKTKLHDEEDNFRNINLSVNGDWLYFVNITTVNNYNRSYSYRMRTDGTDRERIGYFGAWSIVIKDWIFHSFGSGLYSSHIGGVEPTHRLTESSGYFVIDGDWVYYTNSNAEGNINSLYKIRTDGTENTKLNDVTSYDINVAGDWIYYIAQEDPFDFSSKRLLYKIRTDGTENTRISDLRINYMNISGDWIYMMWSNYLHKMRLDGTELTQLNEHLSLDINVVGDWIYYNTRLSGGNILYRIRTDGTEQERVSDIRD